MPTNKTTKAAHQHSEQHNINFNIFLRTKAMPGQSENILIWHEKTSQAQFSIGIH